MEEKNIVYRIGENITFRQTRPDLIMAFDKVKGVMYEFNESASTVLNLIDGKKTLDEIIAELMETYEGDEETIRKEVDEIIERFTAVSIIEGV